MKKIIKGILVLSLIILLSACKNYEPITYTKFTETFSNRDGYIVNNQTLRYENQFAYYEFKTDEEARQYITDNYKNRSKYSFKDKKDYIIVKCNNKMYFKAIQVGKTVIVGNTSIKKNKKEVNKILKELGY